MRHEQHECNPSATLATWVWHKCDTNASQVRHEYYRNDTSATRVKIVDFDNDMGKNIFSHTYIYYKASERLQGEEQFHAKNYLYEMSCFHAKMRLNVQHKNFLMTKVISKSCTLDCSCKRPCTFRLQLCAFKEFCTETRLSNIFKTTIDTNLTKVIQESSYRVLQVTFK